MNKYLLLLLILTFSWFFFSFKTTEVPPAINGDEVPVGVNAILIAKTLHDENGKFLPVFFSAQNLNDFKQPVTTYTTAFLFKILGPSYGLLRQVSVIIVLISAFLIFLLLNEIFEARWAFTGMLIFLTIPIVMIQSHLALENIAPVPFIIGWFLMLFNFRKKGKLIYIFFAGIITALSFYSYPGMRLILPVMCLLSMAYIAFFNKQKFLKPSLFFIAGLMPFLITLPLVHKAYPGAILAYNRPEAPKSYQDFILPFISSFDPSFLFIKGDSTPYHSTGKQGMFLLASLPLFLIGLYQAIRGKNDFLKFILICFFCLPLLYGLVPQVHRASRLLILIPSFTILTTLGLITVSQLRNKSLNFIVVTFAISLLVLNYYDFVRDYWYSYPGRIKSDFIGEAYIAFGGLYKSSKEFNLTPLMQRSIYNNELPGAKFFELVYFPSNIKTWDIGEKIPHGVVLLHHQSDLNLVSDQGLKKLDIGMPYYYLSKNE